MTVCDYYLITHEHLDHLDPGTVSAVAERSGRTRFVAPACCHPSLLELGVRPDRLYRAATDRVLRFDDVEIVPIPAAHETLEEDPVMGHRWVGYIIRLNGVTLYHAGDTVVYPGLVERLKAEKIQVGMLPINGGDFFRRNGGIVGNMGYREAAELAYAAGFDMTIPLHYDVFAFNGERPGYFADYCHERFPYLKYHIMARAERFIFVGEQSEI